MIFFFSKGQSTPALFRRGVTMIELMVTTGIFAFISATLFVNYPLFSSRIALENLTQEVALSVRQAQVYGVSAKAGGSQSYGIYFYTNGQGPKEFYLFEDLDRDGFMDDTANGNQPALCNPGSTDECIERFRIQGNELIGLLCQGLKSDSVTLPRTVEALNVLRSDARCSNQTLHITYKRPNPNAVIHDFPNAISPDRNDAEVFIVSPRGDVHAVVIWATGQISIE